jgi:predicted ATPase/DNA-binding SARP family transcriptional activator
MTNTTAHPGLQVRLLGPMSVAVDGREIPIGSPKQRILLAMLALSNRVGVDTLADELWRDTPPASVAATIQTLVSRLRHTLDDAGGGIAIRLDGGGYVMEIEPTRLDVQCFQAHAAAGRRFLADGSFTEAADQLRGALSLWRGEVLADLADREFARVAATRLDDARLATAESLAEAELALGRPAAALELLEPLIAHDPFREQLRARQMVALYRLGRQAEALAAYQALRRTLTDELGLDPTPALQALERQILRQDPDLDAGGYPEHHPGADDAGPRRAELPSEGTLAFLFTDIEGSTRRWEGNRAAMAADLALHDALLREAVAALGGHLFTHTGDGLGAAFPTAASALAAAVAGQRSLGRAAWRGEPLRVRMGVHAGAAEARAGTFLGPTLNLAARLLDDARGGEIVCSQAVADLARDDLPEDVALVGLGARKLEGLARPEPVWQVLHPDLEALRPAPRPAASGLTRALTSFVGREAELAELGAMLPETRLLTITGVGGAGKTRLALELATRMEKQFDHGACVVELAHLRDEALLAHEILAALSAVAGPANAAASADLLYEVLADRHLLLVLDNCEHLLEASARVVAGALRRAPRLVVLATSREVLSVPGEVSWMAPGLSVPVADSSADLSDLEKTDAIGLFVARARTVQPGFGLTPANAGAVARICRRLDGIPLAIELAAARIRVLSVAQLAERLDERFRLLVGGPRSAPSRHQTLRAAMDWSFELLPEPERLLLRRLSVFPQSFDLDAATAVAGDDADALDVLELIAHLIDKSLLVPEGAAETARYRLLETVRQYLAERLADAGEQDETDRRHRSHFVGRVLSASCAGVNLVGDAWARGVALDRENYHRALEGAVAAHDMESVSALIVGLHYSWFWYSSVPTVLHALDPDALSSSNPSFHVEALLGLCNASWITGRFDGEALRVIYERARAIADESGTARDRGMTRYYLGYLARNQGDVATARRWMQDALSVLEGVSIERFWAHYELGWVDMTDGDATNARRHFRAVLTILGDPADYEVQYIHVWAALALAEAATGDPDAAFALARQSVDAARALGLPGVLMMTLVRSTEVAVVAGTVTVPDLAEALRILLAQVSHRWVSGALSMAALVHERQGRPDVAVRLLAGAVAVAESLAENPHPLPVVADLIGAARHRLSDRFGPELLEQHEAAGRTMAVPHLLRTAIEGLES